MKSYKQHIHEAITATTSDFYELMDVIYGDMKELIRYTRQSEELVERLTGKQFETYTSNDGKLFIRYLDNDDEIIISGMISELKRITRDDIEDIQGWMGDLMERMKDGAAVISSLNKYSKPIMMKVVSELERQGYTVDTDSFDIVSFGSDTWETMQIKARK